MRQYLELMVNSQFRQMNDTSSRVAEQLSVRDAFFTHASDYMMGEMTRLVKRVEELEAPDTPGDPMEICIEDVEPILPPQNYQRRLLSGISSQVWTWKTTVPREKSRRDPYGKKGSRGNTPDPHRKRGSRASTPAPRVTFTTAMVAPQALAATSSEAPGSSLDYSAEGSPAYSGDSQDPRPEYLEPSSVVQRLSFVADNLRPELPRSTSLVNINQPTPSQTFVSRYPATVIPPPQPMPGQEVPPTPPVAVATAPGDNVGTRERPVLLVPETPAQHPAFNDLPQPGTRAPRKGFRRACTICGQRQHVSGVCPTLSKCDMCDGKGH